MSRRRAVATVMLGLVLVVLTGLGLGLIAAGPSDPAISGSERSELMGYAQSTLLDNPFQGLLRLSTRVERIPNGSTRPCGPFLGALDVPRGTAWRVTGYGPFGLRIGGGVITCSGDASVDGAWGAPPTSPVLG